MNPRLAVALPVLPLSAHAATLFWHAAYLDQRFDSAFFAEATDAMRDLAYLLIGCAVVLMLVALLTPRLGRPVGAILLYATLPLQFIWFELLAFVFWEDRDDAQRETTTSVAFTYLATAAVLVTATIVAVVVLRRPRAATGTAPAGTTAHPAPR
jgi:hypothetical protein